MTPEEAVAKLNDLHGYGDAEYVHSEADAILLLTVPDEVREAYEALRDAQDWWAFA